MLSLSPIGTAPLAAPSQLVDLLSVQSAYHEQKFSAVNFGLETDAAYHAHVHTVPDYGMVGLSPIGTAPLAAPSQLVDQPYISPVYRATPISFSYSVFITVAGKRLASNDEMLGGYAYEGRLISFPQPSEYFRDMFGQTTVDRFDVDIENAEFDLSGSALLGEQATVEVVTNRYYADGSISTDSFKRAMTVSSYSHRAGILALELVDIERQQFDEVYPTSTYTADDWPELLEEDSGKPVPFVVGIALKVPCVQIQHQAGVGPWLFAVCEAPITSVLTVYRNGRIVDPSEYTVGSTGGLATISFAKEQIDFNGNRYEITADVQGAASRNAADELKRILTVAGVTIDTVTFDDAATYASSTKMEVDVGYVDTRRIGSIVDDLLFVLRGHLWKTSTGAFAISQDRERITTAWYTENKGDLVEVSEYRAERPPQKIELEYRLSDSKDTGKYQHKISRTIAGGSGTESYESAFIRDHETADRLLCYLAKRAEYGQTARASVYGEHLSLGQTVEIDGTLLWSGAKQFSVRGVRRGEAVNEADLLIYDADVYTYTAASLPADPVAGYQPDYSQTPPEAPTSVQVVAQAAIIDDDGKVTSSCTVKGTPPSVNWAQIWFAATNTATNETYLGKGSDNGDGTYGATLASLRPGVAHNLVAWAVNSNGVEGVASSPVPFTSATDSTVPAQVTGVSVKQGSGKLLRVTWNASTDADLSHYEVKRNGAIVGTVSATNYVDESINYGTTYTYNIRAIDRSGNVGPWSSNASRTPVVSITDEDIPKSGGGRLITENLIENAATVASSAYTAGSIMMTGGLSEVQAVTVTKTSAPAFILFTTQAFFTSAGTTTDFIVYIYRGATELAFHRINVPASSMEVPISLSLVDTVGAGTYTYRAYMRANVALTSFGAAGRSLAVLETKR